MTSVSGNYSSHPGPPAPLAPSQQSLHQRLVPRAVATRTSIGSLENQEMVRWLATLEIPREYEIKKEQVMKAPSPSSSNCVPTTGSVHCRTEFHEVASWSPGSSTNRLYVDLTVTTVADSSICIGQVFNNDGTSKPVAEIYYSSNGQISIGVEHTAAGGTQGTPTPIKSIPVGTRFNFGRHSKSPFNAPYSFSMLGSRQVLTRCNRGAL